MTNERRQDVILAALILSLAVHIGLMFYARGRIMTHIARGYGRTVRLEAMRVTPEQLAPEPLSLAEIDDVKAEREAPKVDGTELALPSSDPATPQDKLEVKAPDLLSQLDAAPVPDAPLFSVEPVKLDQQVSEKLPLAPVETPKIETTAQAPVASSVAPSARGVPTASVPVFELPSEPLVADLPDEQSKEVTPVGQSNEKEEDRKDAFQPVEEVLEKVDEALVEQEKAAVRDMVDSEKAVELAPFVNAAAATHTEGGWTYFKLMVVPRQALKPVSKDLVVILDASGSIGRDRMGSIRSAAKKILRSAANTGDRFNLVAFRDRFSYAFRRWQECTVTSFDAADRWLNDVAPFGRTDVFSTISSVLTLPRDPSRPLIALVVTDGDANEGVSDTHEILAKFTALNDGLISVYMYGVKSSANRELIDLLTRGNRGESYIYEGYRWKAGAGIETLSERFRDPVLSDLRIVFSSDSKAEAYPRVLRNLYRGETLSVLGRVPAGTASVSFSLKGLNGRDPYEGYFTVPLVAGGQDAEIAQAWNAERTIDRKLRKDK